MASPSPALAIRRSRRVSLALLGIAAAAAVALWLARPSVATPQRVLLVSIDTLRADHLGAYGYARPTSPSFDALAARGVLFEDASSPAPWTLPAHASLLTGVYPSRHGLKSHDRYLPHSLPTLASLFGKHGWVTAAVVNSQNLSPRFGLDRGFQEYRFVEEDVERREPSREIVDQALAWLEQHRDARLFLFLHSYDVHSDYASEPRYEREFARPYAGEADGTTRQLMAFRDGRAPLAASDAPRLVDLYDAGIRQFDDELRRLVDGLRERRLLADTLLVITSDHGEEFFEHGGVLHGRTQFQEVVRVPLVLVGPGLPPGRRIAAPVSLVDLLPTTLGLVGIPLPGTSDGDDLAPLWRGEPAPRFERRHVFGEADHNNAVPDVTRFVRRGALKLHFDRASGKSALYDLASDPGETTDVSARHAVALASLRQRLERFLQIQPALAPSVELSQEEIEKLRALGYVQ